MFSRPQFQRATCKGSYLLGTACNNCERCEWERANNNVRGVQEAAAYGTIFEFPADRVVKMIACSKCGQEMEVSERTVMAFCSACSETLGRKS